MKPFSDYSKAQLTQLGAVARSCLAHGQQGRVLAAFSGALYLATDAGEVFWIATEVATMHRRCALSSTPLPGPSGGASFQVVDQRLTIDPAYIFEIGSVPVWHAPSVNAQKTLDITALSACIRTFFSNLEVSQAKGFGEFFPSIAQLAYSGSATLQPVLADTVLRSAYPLVLEMARACLEHHPSRLSLTANALIGLGAGLTPSGDDFLGGLLFAVKNLRAAYPDLNFSHYAFPVESYASQTNLISFTLLSDLAEGHAIEPLHHIVNGLLHGASYNLIHPAISKLTRLGHSTGWDLLTGLLTGLLTACATSL